MTSYAEELGAEAYKLFLKTYNDKLAATQGQGENSAIVRGAVLVDALIRVVAVAAVDVGIPPDVVVGALQEALASAEARAPRFG